MKKLFSLSLLIFASLTIQVGNARAEGSPMPGGYGGAPSPIEVQAGDKLHLCIQGQANAALFHPAEEGSVKGVIITLEDTGTDLFQAGQRLSMVNGGKSDEITLRNKDDSVYFTNADFVYDSLSGKKIKILNAFDRHEDFDPYIDFETANGDRLPCRTPAANGLSFFVPSTYKIKAESFLLYVTEVQVLELSPEDNAANAEEQQSPQEPAPPAIEPESSLQENPAPQSGGCSMSAVIPGMNYGLSILFALTLGAHALFRFRKQ